ncbi:MAG: HAMP domain-containing histidine kinase [Bacteroidales bacterium]|nr:HAMP domain-containing histidine kinase [Bacteroidales bacterium]
MNIYSKKIRWKFLFFLGASLIGIASLYFTNLLVQKLAAEEHKKIESWAHATKIIVSEDTISNAMFEYLLRILENNETIPLIVLDGEDNIIQDRNIDSTRLANPRLCEKLIADFKKENDPIIIDLGFEVQYLYYTNSTILQQLTTYPYIQLGVIVLFIFVAYLAFSTSRKAEQNQVWLGLTKETAHQLGTPISSLLAWKEILKMKLNDEQISSELEKDINRLEKITDRFSKIGSKPILKEENLKDVVEEVINYLRPRSSGKIKFSINAPEQPVTVPLNASLFEWVIENICKNAMDAINGKGEITLTLSDYNKFIFLDIKDTGKGIPRGKQKTIFKPGYTTKERGWGLGLSLTKRIVEVYHQGRIFVTDSAVGKGTEFRIILNR